MELLIGAAIYALIIQKMWVAARTDHELAKQGKISPRLEAKYGSQQAARAKVEKYGFFDFLKDAYHDFWGRRGDALVAARNAKPAPGRTKVRLRDRIAAAGVAVTGAVKDVAGKVAASPVVRKLIDPVETKPTLQPAVPTPEPLVVNTGDVPEGTRRYTDHGQEEYRDGQWRPVPKQPDTFGGAPAKPAGGAMTAPTGEATNYETTVAELESLAREQRAHLERCEAALQQIESAKASIGDMQESYRASSAAAASTAEHLAARNLDGVTLANAGTTADAMPAGKVDVMFDQLEMMEAEAKARRDDAEVALGATEANLAHIQATYGDAHATVAGNLSGDASFLDGGGAGPVRNAAGQPAGSPRLQQARSDAAAAGRDGGQRAYDRAMGDHGYTPEGSAPPGPAGRGTPTVRVYDEPVDARGAHFGSTVHGGGGAGSTANVFNDEVVRD